MKEILIKSNDVLLYLCSDLTLESRIIHEIWKIFSYNSRMYILSHAINMQSYTCVIRLNIHSSILGVVAISQEYAYPSMLQL